MFERDFSENQKDDKISVNDTKFLNQVEESIHQREDGHFVIGLPFMGNELLWVWSFTAIFTCYFLMTAIVILLHLTHMRASSYHVVRVLVSVQ